MLNSSVTLTAMAESGRAAEGRRAAAAAWRRRETESELRAQRRAAQNMGKVRRERETKRRAETTGVRASEGSPVSAVGPLFFLNY